MEKKIFLLKNKYDSEVKKDLITKFKYKSVMEVPILTKIVLNMTIGKGNNDSKAIDEVMEHLALISGQKPIQTNAKKSLASFKLREGMPIGAKVTLRKKNMWNFLSKLIDIAIPRIRDFRGIPKKSFDSHGNFAFGIKEQIIFPEIKFDKVNKIRGLDVIIVTSAKTDEEARELLKLLGVPFKK